MTYVDLKLQDIATPLLGQTRRHYFIGDGGRLVRLPVRAAIWRDVEDVDIFTMPEQLAREKGLI